MINAQYVISFREKMFFKEFTSKQIKLILEGNEGRRENAEEHKCDRNKFPLERGAKTNWKFLKCAQDDTMKKVLYIIYSTETPDLINWK